MLVCCGVLCGPILALLALADTTKERVLALEVRMAFVDEKIGEATKELKQISARNGLSAPADALGSHLGSFVAASPSADSGAPDSPDASGAAGPARGR